MATWRQFFTPTKTTPEASDEQCLELISLRCVSSWWRHQFARRIEPLHLGHCFGDVHENSVLFDAKDDDFDDVLVMFDVVTSRIH